MTKWAHSTVVYTVYIGIALVPIENDIHFQFEVDLTFNDISVDSKG